MENFRVHEKSWNSADFSAGAAGKSSVALKGRCDAERKKAERYRNCTAQSKKLFVLRVSLHDFLRNLMLKAKCDSVASRSKIDFICENVPTFIVEAAVLEEFVVETDYMRLVVFNDVVGIGFRKTALDFEYILSTKRTMIRFMFVLPCEIVILITTAFENKKLVQTKTFGSGIIRLS